MNGETEKITSFTKLNAWQLSHRLVLSIYQLSGKFPREESFGLTNQMRRAAVSISSNIAEGFSRFSYREKINFYLIALGSLTELQNQILIAKDIRYISYEEFDLLAKQAIDASKTINGLIKKSRTFIHTS